MDCRKCLELIPMLLTERLEESDSSDVRRHISLCSECGKAYDRMAVFLAGLRSMKEINATPWLAQRIKSEIAAERYPASRILLSKWVQAPVMALVILLAVGVGNLTGARLSEILVATGSEQTPAFVLDDQASSIDDLIMKIDTNESIP
jgi:hypothetical protein